MNEVNGQQIPNLEEMNEQEAHRFLAELLSNLSPEVEYDVRHQDYVMEIPQSGERFPGRKNMRAFQRARGDHATPPRSLRLRRVLVEEGLWVVEAVIERATSPEPTNGMPKTALPSGRNPASASGARRTCWRSKKLIPLAWSSRCAGLSVARTSG